MEAGEIDLSGLLMDFAGKAIKMNFIRYIWEQVRLTPSFPYSSADCYP